MYNLELSRAVELDRRREIDEHLEHRRAIRDQASATRSSDRPSGARVGGRADTVLRPSR